MFTSGLYGDECCSSWVARLTFVFLILFLVALLLLFTFLHLVGTFQLMRLLKSEIERQTILSSLLTMSELVDFDISRFAAQRPGVDGPNFLWAFLTAQRSY